MAQTGSQPPMYMTVPDKIELTAAAVPGGYPARDLAADDQNQRYMQIPDTITLGGGASSPAQRGNGGVPEGKANDDSSFVRLQGQADEANRELPALQRPRTGAGEVHSNVNPAVELEQRVKTLEDKVQQITTTLQSQGSQVGRVSNFWYVVTFTSWMLVPLIALAMYRYKK